MDSLRIMGLVDTSTLWGRVDFSFYWQRLDLAKDILRFCSFASFSAIRDE